MEYRYTDTMLTAVTSTASLGEASAGAQRRDRPSRTLTSGARCVSPLAAKVASYASLPRHGFCRSCCCFWYCCRSFFGLPSVPCARVWAMIFGRLHRQQFVLFRVFLNERCVPRPLSRSSHRMFCLVSKALGEESTHQPVSVSVRISLLVSLGHTSIALLRSTCLGLFSHSLPHAYDHRFR